MFSFKCSSKYFLFILILVFHNSYAQKQPNKKPNIVFFLVDDLGWTDTQPYGSTFYETPNINKLAKEGMLFTDAYAACPVCSPTRASLMTGKYPVSLQNTDWFGAPQPEAEKKKPNWAKQHLLYTAPYKENLALEETTIAEALKANGYATFFAGKWHLGGTPKYWPEHQGFDVNKGGYSAGNPGVGGYFSPYKNPRLTDGPAGEYLPTRLATETNKFIEENKDKPFFAEFSFYSVHIPEGAKKEIIEKYQKKRDRLGLKDVYGMEGGHKVRTVQSEAVYASMVEAMDTAIGQVMAKLKELNLEKNTIIVFFSDNGGLSITEGTPTSNLPLRGGKGWMYEGGIREPMIVKWEGIIKPNTKNNTPVISNDFYPTFLQMVGAPLMPKQHTGGVSLLPLLKDKKIAKRSLFWHYPHYGDQGGSPGSAVRNGDWKLIHWYEHDRFELFNLKNNISEQHNVIDKYPKEAAKLKEELSKWLKDQGALFPTKV